jgi:hypothetical protein
MVRKNHGGLPTAALHGGSPPPFTFDTCDLNFLKKNWSKYMVRSPDTFEDALNSLAAMVAHERPLFDKLLW